MKVFIVTAGEYSDYHIVSAFSTKERAEEFEEAYDSRIKSKYGKADIEEYELDTPKDKWECTFVRMDKEGNVLYTRGGFNEEPHFGFDSFNNLHITVQTSDVKRAVKVANEKRAQLIALNRWGKELK